MKNYLAILFAILSGCINPSSTNYDPLIRFRNATKICDVLSNPTKYVGTYLSIRALYVDQPHDRILVGLECPQNGLILRTLSTLDDPNARRAVDAALRKNRTAMVPVVYYGIVKSEPLVVNCTKQSCFTYLFEEARLVAADKSGLR
jgi:hypothetical protein